MLTNSYIGLLQTKLIEMKTLLVSNVVKTMADFAFTAGNPDQASVAIIMARTGGLMITWDGSNPTATVGFLVPANTSITIYGNAKIQALKFLREAAVDSQVTISLEE